jgi:uncharacterized membrane protein YeaQ/YmgE (transglycosylase-associated protein family)
LPSDAPGTGTNLAKRLSATLSLLFGEGPEEIRVEMHDGRTIEAKDPFFAASEGFLYLTAADDSVIKLPAEEIATVWRRGVDPRLGLLIGATGGAIGALTSALWFTRLAHNRPAQLFLGGLVGVIGGSVVIFLFQRFPGMSHWARTSLPRF